MEICWNLIFQTLWFYPLESASSPSVLSFPTPAQPCLPTSVISCQIPHTPLQRVSFLLKRHKKIEQLSIMLIMLCFGWGISRYLKGSLGPPVVYLWEMKVSLQEDFTLKKWGSKGDDFWNQKSRMILSSVLHLTLESISKHWGVESESKSHSVVSDSLRPCGL